MSIGWALFWVLVGFLVAMISYAISLTTRNPDFEIDETEESSGVINVKYNNKVQSDIDADGVRNDSSNESDGA